MTPTAPRQITGIPIHKHSMFAVLLVAIATLLAGVSASYDPINGASCLRGHTLCEHPHPLGKPFCANLKLDRSHCGTCNRACSGGYGRCLDGHCHDEEVCAEGLRGCWGGANTQIEYQCVDVQTHNWHCGNCNAACFDAGTGCVNGTCVPVENPPPRAPWLDAGCHWCGDRDGAGDGCVNTDNDNRNCGGCQKMVSGAMERR